MLTGESVPTDVAPGSEIVGTTVNLTVNNATGANIGLTFLCTSNLGPLSPTGLDLAILGAPGCVANVDINTGTGLLVSNIPGVGSLTTPLPIPNNVALVGFQVFCQSIWIDAAQNAGGLLTSNALRLGIGSF